MKIHIFGCLSGTEPMHGKHHTSWALEHNGSLYMFDAGDNCAHTAFLMGLDLTKIKALFISHTHRDHIDGLFHLTGVISKILELDPSLPAVTLPVHTSEKRLVPAINTLIGLNGPHPHFTLESREFFHEGEIFRSGNISIEVLGTEHIKKTPENQFCSWSFRIQAGNKVILYSGDVKDPGELTPFLEKGCDLLLMESGHHSPPALCQMWKEKNYAIGKLLFIHHGREFLRDEALCEKRCSQIFPSRVLFAHDGMSLDLEEEGTESL